MQIKVIVTDINYRLRHEAEVNEFLNTLNKRISKVEHFIVQPSKSVSLSSFHEARLEYNPDIVTVITYTGEL